jgi:hypothetical protein
VIPLMWRRVGSGTVESMPATATPEPRPLARHPQRPWRRVEPAHPRGARRPVEHRFAAPCVRELPPRREAPAAAGTW